MDIDFTYEPGEKETFDYPGSPYKVHIESVNVKEVDIYDLLDFEQLHDIKTIILKKIEQSLWIR